MSHNPLSKHTLPYPCSPKDTLPPTFSPMSNSLPTPTPATNHFVDEVVFVGGHGGTNNLMINKINHPSKFVKSKYKIGLVGTYCSGKSSLAHRFAQGSFSDEYRMSLSTSTTIRIQLLQQDRPARRLPLPQTGTNRHPRIGALNQAPAAALQRSRCSSPPLRHHQVRIHPRSEQSFCKLEEFLG